MKTMDRTLTENDNHNFNERSNITQLSSPPCLAGPLNFFRSLELVLSLPDGCPAGRQSLFSGDLFAKQTLRS